MPDLSNTMACKAVGSNSGENPALSNNGEDPNRPVANTQQYVSTGPDKYITEKEDILRWSLNYPRKHIGSLEQALRLHSYPDTQRYLDRNFDKQYIQYEKDSVCLLNKVKDYFDAIDAGWEPSDEAIEAFKERKKIYLGFTTNDNWKGPFLDYNNPLNVRKDALHDLEKMK